MPDTPAPRRREPGVRYRRVTKQREVATVIDGIRTIHIEDYEVDEPVPPTDWDTIVLRGVIGIAVSLIVLAFLGTATAAGGLLSDLLHPVIGHLLGLVFTAIWLGCLGLEWLDGRIDPDRAVPARVAGWIALALSMGAVIVYGHTRGVVWVGVAGACIDLSAKAFATLVLRRYQVRLSKGVANWVIEQEQRAAGRALVSDRLRKLGRGEAYRRAVGGPEYQAAEAIFASSPSTPAVAPPPSGQPDRTASAQATPPTPPVSGTGTDTGPDNPGEDTEHASSVRLISVPSIAAMARRALEANPRMLSGDPGFYERVLEVHPDAVADSVRRTVARERKKLGLEESA